MKNTDPDTLYKIAENQAGYFTAKQAKQAGYSRQRLYDFSKGGQFTRVEHGIYRLTYFPASRFEDLYIAFLRTGPKSVISHESALSVYGLTDILPAKVHIIIPRTGSRRRTNIQLHTNRLEPDEITAREGLSITTPARTIADAIASGVESNLIEQAITEALRRGLTSRDNLLKQAKRRGGRVAEQIQRVIGMQEK